MRWLGGLFSFLVFLAGLGSVLVLHPATPLPPAWNPTLPLDVTDKVTPLTRLKLRRALSGPACAAALTTSGAQFDSLPDLVAAPDCGIEDRLRLRSLGTVRIDPLETRCAIALRLAMWTEHGLTPAARSILGSGLREVHHLDSYNCRRIRTPGGTGARMSTHATAEAIDITGVTLDDGRRIALASDWGSGDAGEFLKAARDSACTWFVTTLGPDFNALHADHFHLQSRGWGLCR